MPQNDYVEQSIRLYGRELNYEVKKAKKEARREALTSKQATTLTGMKAKLFHKKLAAEKIQLKKNKKITESKLCTKKVEPDTCALPAYLLDREMEEQTRELSSKIKQNRKDKAAKYTVPIAKVEGLSQAEVFGVVSSGKRHKKHWKRMVNRPCFVGQDFTRKAPKFERFIRPMGLRFTKAYVSHPELKTTFTLPILSVKKNPHSEVFTGLGVLSKGTIIEVNVSELGLVNGSGQVIWGKYAQITNKPENDGCVNAVLLA
ncbi:ribosome biogenesis protein NSA2 [Pancytospora epiphaga]|nr:ribosome biogenesis protein NSA2 [Pancytospora epiphaga]